ncbi:MAG: hypothetical protein ACMZI0_04000 [Symbiopectobacterium sp.]|uniref:hypothetical protein n=1 Tax=Symbiopectobacterium sp. TaxID=2952789 RepID=UPI0039ED31D6
MFDTTHLTLEEMVDQCRALTHAVIELDNAMAKEVLLFLLAERLEVLSAALEGPDTLGEPSECDDADSKLH